MEPGLYSLIGDTTGVMTQKTYDEIAEAWAEEIARGDSLEARYKALEDRLKEYESVIGAMCHRRVIRISREELRSAPAFDVAVEDSFLTIRRR